MDWTFVFILIGGLALFLAAVWIWRGRGPRARSWIRFPIVGDLASLMAFPSVGAICIGAALSNLGMPDWVSMPIALAGFIPIVWGFPILIIARFYWPAQRLWGPAWYTTLSKEQTDQMESRVADILNIGARKPPTWVGKNLNYWCCRHINHEESTPGHLWLNEHGVFFDPSKTVPSSFSPARAQWRDLQHFERNGRTLTVTFLKRNTPVTHTFSMPRLRARRAEQHIFERYESETDSE